MSLTLTVHVILGFVVLFSGLIAMLARKRKGLHTWMGEIYHWAWLGMAITAMMVGSQHAGISIFEIVTIPSYAMALQGYVMGKRRTRLSQDWLHWHIQGMAGSYIGVITAFGFQIVPRIGLPLDNPLIFWGWAILPGVVGGWMIGRTLERWTGKARRARAARAAGLVNS